KYDDASMSLSDWLGGQLVTVPTAASTPPPSGRRGSSGSNVDAPYNDPYRAGSPSSSSDPYGSPDSYRTPDPYGSSRSTGGRKPVEIEPIAITPAMLGSILQSVGGFQSMCEPLKAATDEASFHLAAEQLIGSIRGLMSMVGS